ncbi:MAG: transcriptional repressor LexA [Treponemataceae bacterium]
MQTLTNRQLEILRYIRDFANENAIPPTIREIATHFETTLKTIQDHVKALIKKEYIATTEKRSRSLRILVNPDEQDCISTVPDSKESALVRSIPLLGSVAAGKPLLAEENIESFISVPTSMLKPHATYFALQVKGDSMTGAGIFNGDTAIIEKCPNAQNKDIVVAVLNDAITLKRFYKEAKRIRLDSENDAYNPIFCNDIRIAGKLKTIIRSY